MNSHDIPGLVASFTDDAMVNDVQREFWGAESITRWARKEIVGDKVVATG